MNALSFASIIKTIDENSIIGGVYADEREILINKWRSYYCESKG
jgi:hypothetical protein